MPTQESWIDGTTIFVDITAPLTSNDLSACFKHLAAQIANSPQPVDILADVTQAGMVPVDAPALALHTGLLTDPHLRNVAVIGSSDWVQFLGRIATRRSNKPIVFYETYEQAAEALGLGEHVRVD